MLGSLLLISCFSSPSIRLIPVDDPVGSGREWFRAEYVGLPNNNCPPPIFSVTPSIYLEQWANDPFYGFIAGVDGVYTVSADGPTNACNAHGELVITIVH